MAYQTKMLVRNTGRSQQFRFVVLVIGCFLVSMTFILISRPQSFPFAYIGSKAPTKPSEAGDPLDSSRDPLNLSEINNDEKKVIREDVKEDNVHKSTLEENPEDDEVPVDKDEMEKGRTSDKEEERDETQKRLTLPTVSNYTINDHAQEKEPPQSEKTALPELGGDLKNLRKQLCDFSDARFDICEMTGDVRIAGNSSVVFLAEPAEQLKQETWKLHPYARKGDDFCLGSVRELTVRSSSDAPECTVRHKVPAVFFSSGGYSGNFFHDFTDLLIPLYLAARRYHGEVQLVAADYSPYWIYKYLLFFQKLSKYPVIDYEKDKEVHCFDHVVVGLRSHKEFGIDPARAPGGDSIVDFTKFMREAYSLERDSMTNIEDLHGRRPRLLLIQRKLSRSFNNIWEIIQMADDMGFEVVVDEAEAADMAKFAKLANSVDVLIGVHGEGLAGMVFLPPNATVVQVVPWGGLEELAMYNYGTPAKEMRLNYLQYSISVEESTLTEQYPRDHVVFKDPKQIHKEGNGALQSTFLKNQNVKIDVKRFRNTVWKALEYVIM